MSHYFFNYLNTSLLRQQKEKTSSWSNTIWIKVLRHMLKMIVFSAGLPKMVISKLSPFS